MISKILLSLVAVIILFIATVGVTASFQSDDMVVSRSTTIQAPPATVFGIVNDFHQWGSWSPWDKYDPSMTKTYEGPAQGVGAVYKWSGNDEVGEGKNTVIESTPNEKIGMKLEFFRPFAGTSDVTFTFAPEGEGTKVTWTMGSKKNFIMKTMSLFMDCEKMCGDQFDEGLANLKKVAESAPKA